MDSEGAEMRQQMDDTMAGLTDKLEDLGDHFSGTVETVRNSVNSVRDTLDVKRQVRRHPFTAMAGAAALGLFLGFRPDGNPRRNNGNPVRPVTGPPAARPCAGANDDANGAGAGRTPAAAVPSWLAKGGEMFKPEINALRGVAVGVLLEVVRGAIMNPVAKPARSPAGDASVSNATLADPGGRAR